MQDFQNQVDKYEPQMAQLSSLAAAVDSGVAGEAQTAQVPSSNGPVNGGKADKNHQLQDRYERLKALTGQRQEMLADYLPSVQQYESSRGAWQDLLCGWEEKVEQLPPPFATPTAIQAQLQDIKVCTYVCT